MGHNSLMGNDDRGWLLSVFEDDLTGLPTKVQHKLEATKILEQKAGRYAYVSCDVADVKYVSEMYGYAYGNVALKHIARVLYVNLKQDELVSRTTGDQFCMLLKYTDVKSLERRILSMAEQASVFPIDELGGTHKAVFNCGVYLIQGGEDINMIRARANAARKKNEASFKTQITFYSSLDLVHELESKELEADVVRALRDRELEVYLQPKYDIRTEKIRGAEALIRWNHPEKGMLSPAKFVPACEANGFICTIDFFVLEEVCRHLREWKEQERQLVKVSVNFSRRHLAESDFVSRLIEAVRYYDLEPSDLEIELTESVAYDEMGTLLKVMHQIKEAGFGLSMDDFGSGYSSLSLLREMPVDVLKLDKGFLDGCHGNEKADRDKRIIYHIISMAKDLQITVLAEGVETEQQKEFLKALNCDMIQGYYYAKPMPADRFATYLDKISA